MKQTKRFAVVGSDARQAAAGRALARAGYIVGGVQQLPQADYILLPLPLEQSGLPLAQLLGAAKPGALALGGKVTDGARTIARAAGVELVDYFARPELTVYNAIPTAEGCIGILLERRSRTLWGAAVLVLGFGPVGRALAVRLAALGARCLLYTSPSPRGAGTRGASHFAGAGGKGMTTEKKGCLAFAVCGSFCTLEDALGAAQALTAQGWTLLPVMSFAAQLDTRFGTGESWRQRLQAVTGQPVLDTLQAVEPLGPRRLAQALVVAPCTGATLARLAAGLSDTPVTLADKSLLRVGSPVVLAVSTNDGLGASGENMARLCQRKHYYFVPYGQDDPFAKPQSLKADLALLPAAVDAALRGEQLQPVLLGQRNA